MGNTNNPYADQYGFRVIEIKPGSPAEKSGLQVSADFIVTINGRNLNDMETSEITRLVAENENKVLNLLVWSSLTEASREVSLTPSRKWPGEGLLGVIIRYDRYDADKKSSEQNMAFDQLYEGESGATATYRNDKLNPRVPPGAPAAPPSPEKQASTSFFGSLPGLGKSKSGKQTVENPARTYDLDSEFSFDKIYAGNTFQEDSPMQQGRTQRNGTVRNKPAAPTDEFSGTNTLAKSPAVSDKATPQKGTPGGANGENGEETPTKRRTSLSKTLSSTVFGWASGEKQK